MLTKECLPSMEKLVQIVIEFGLQGNELMLFMENRWENSRKMKRKSTRARVGTMTAATADKKLYPEAEEMRLHLEA